MELDAEGKTLDGLGTHRCPPGRYHVVLSKVDESLQGDMSNAIMMCFQVLEGTTPKQRGAIHFEFYNLEPKDGGESGRRFLRDKLLRTGMALELIRPGEGKRDCVFSTAIGRQLVIEVVNDEYEGKKKLKIGNAGFAVWPVDHADVQDVPKDSKALELHGKPGAQQAVLPGQPAAADVSAGDKWGDLR